MVGNARFRRLRRYSVRVNGRVTIFSVGVTKRGGRPGSEIGICVCVVSRKLKTKIEIQTFFHRERRRDKSANRARVRERRGNESERGGGRVQPNRWSFTATGGRASAVGVRRGVSMNDIFN